MAQKLLAVVVCSVAAAGCSNVLGYDDITFESGDAGVATGSGGFGGSAAGNGEGGNFAGSGGEATGGASSGGTSSGGASSGGASSGGASSGGTSSGGASSGGASSGGTSSGGASSGGSAGLGGAAATVCDRWKADRANLSEGTWSGSEAGCNAGDIGATGRANALKLVNLYRWLVGLPAVTTLASRDADAQECALMMDANNSLSHSPPASWACYTAAGAGAAGKSNLATTPGVKAVDLYIADPGNETTMGHRRWILSNGLGPIGLGSTSNYSCMWVIGGSGSGSNTWTAFPPPGPVPLAMFTISYASLDSTGWTVQSDSVNLSNAQVTITDAGVNLPVTVVKLAGGYGSSQAINIKPQGWKALAGHTYQVTVSGASQPISYAVEVVACP
jgi:uncharacterized protein YkwD